MVKLILFVMLSSGYAETTVKQNITIEQCEKQAEKLNHKIQKGEQKFYYCLSNV